MTVDTQKLIESKLVVEKIANGVNPIDNKPINDSSFLNDPQVLRSIFYLFSYLVNGLNNKKPTNKPKKFIISDEQLENIILPPGKIGIRDFANSINEVIDSSISKKVNGTMLNKKLKAMGILSETIDENGRRRTVTNENSEGYGIESVKKTFNGNEYIKVVFNDVGKEFLLKNLRELMS